MNKRIIPISSGKGGVGKTTFAINLSLALSQYGSTVLVDLDTGTSSVRNIIDVPVTRDLYHFFEKDAPLESCITTLPAKMDPQGRFKQFGFIASPLHMVDRIANMGRPYRNRLIDAVNALKCRYMVLDIKAGVDAAVIDFLPQSNTGLLMFTPGHPAATHAAANIVKAIMFRKVRSLFFPKSPVFDRFAQGTLDCSEIHQMVDMAEDAYNDGVDNLDGMIEKLAREMPGHPVCHLLSNVMSCFNVFYVLNRFDGVDRSFDQVIKPFRVNIFQSISSQINVQNLGWLIESEKFDHATSKRVPFLVAAQYRQKRKKAEQKSAPSIDDAMAELYQLGGLKPTLNRPTKRRRIQARKEPRQSENALFNQLKTIENLYQHQGRTEVDNIEYIVARIRYLIQSGMTTAFGDHRLYKKGEMIPLFGQN